MNSSNKLRWELWSKKIGSFEIPKDAEVLPSNTTCGFVFVHFCGLPTSAAGALLDHTDFGHSKAAVLSQFRPDKRKQLVVLLSAF